MLVASGQADKIIAEKKRDRNDAWFEKASARPVGIICMSIESFFSTEMQPPTGHLLRLLRVNTQPTTLATIFSISAVGPAHRAQVHIYIYIYIPVVQLTRTNIVGTPFSFVFVGF